MKKSSVVILPGGMDANGQGDDDNDDKNSGHHAEYGQHQRVKLHLMGFAICKEDWSEKNAPASQQNPLCLARGHSANDSQFQCSSCTAWRPAASEAVQRCRAHRRD